MIGQKGKLIKYLCINYEYFMWEIEKTLEISYNDRELAKSGED